MRTPRPLLAALLLALALAAPAAAADLVVFAAASLKNALDEAARQLPGEERVRISYAASSALARQLEQGAPADLFIAADTDWMDWAAERGLVRPRTRVALAGNRLVLIAPAGAARPLALPDGFAAALGAGRLAIADPAAVPAGRYGKAALQSLGLWETARTRLAPAENVRAALAFVARGEAPLGLVYATDAHAEPSVAVVARIDPGLHEPIVYPGAVAAESTHPGAEALLAWLAGPAAQAIFARHGFAPPPGKRSGGT
jgi:molybdate transport system substrate-binding protein